MTATLSRLSIDYGSSHTVAVLARPDGAARTVLFDGAPTLPSAVCAAADGSLLVGRDAVHEARVHPERFERNPKRRIDEGSVLLGTAEVTVPAMIGAVLSRVADEARRVAGGPLGPVTLTHPAAWGRHRCGILREAAGLAGLGPVHLVPEPVAAAAYYVDVLGGDLPEGGTLVIYDFGAGTFDASVVRREGDGFAVLATEGLPQSGGLDVDATIMAHLGVTYGTADPDAWRRLTFPQAGIDRRASLQLWEDIRSAKELLSRNSATYIHLPLLERDAPLGREQLELLAGPIIGQTVTATRAALAAAGLTRAAAPGATPSGATPPGPPISAIFLVGGASRMPLVATRLHQALHLAPTVIEQPEVAVATGGLRTEPSTPEPSTPDGTGETTTEPDVIGPNTAEPESITPTAAEPNAAEPTASTIAEPRPAESELIPVPEPIPGPRPADQGPAERPRVVAFARVVPPPPPPQQPLPTDPELPSSPRKRWRLLVAAAAAVLIAASVTVIIVVRQRGEAGLTTDSAFTVGILMPEKDTVRYESIDRPVMEAKLKQLCPNCTVLASNADWDATTQLSQAEEMLGKGAKVLILDPVDSAAAAEVATKARAAGAKVIAYDRPVEGPVDYYVGYSTEKVGVMQGEALLAAVKAGGDAHRGKVVLLHGPKSDPNSAGFKAGALSVLAGEVTIGREIEIESWDPTTAHIKMVEAVTEFSKENIIGVYAANDGLASGAVLAFEQADLETFPPITGQDADVEALQRILAGKQYMTVYKGPRFEAETAAQLAVAAGTGKSYTVQEVTSVNNGTADVASVLLAPVAVTKANLKSVLIDSGFYAKDEICVDDFVAACESAGIR